MESIPKGVKMAHCIAPEAGLTAEFDGLLMNDTREYLWGHIANHDGMYSYAIDQHIADVLTFKALYPKAKIGMYQVLAGSYNPAAQSRWFLPAIENADVSFPAMYLANPGEDKKWVRESLEFCLKHHYKVVPVVCDHYLADANSPHYQTLLTPEDAKELNDIIKSVRVKAWGRERKINDVLGWFLTWLYENRNHLTTWEARNEEIKQQIINWKKTWK